jgi:hypothetical protein
MMMAPALKPEILGDTEEGDPPVTGEQQDELGLTPEERAEWDSMRDDTKTPTEPTEEPGEAPPSETVPKEGDTALDTLPAPGEPKKEAPPKKDAPPEEDDEPDQVTRDPRTGKEQRTISYGKHQRLLNKERAAAEALRTQAEEGRISQAKLAERLAILNDALMAPPVPTQQQQEEQQRYEAERNPMLEETIDPSIDLAGALGQMQRRQIFMANASMMQQESTQEQIADQAMVRDFTRDSQLFSQTEEGQHFFGPEGAYQFLKNSRLVELGYNLFRKDASDPNERFTQDEISRMVSEFNTEEKWLVNKAFQAGDSPAKAVMWHARARGWRAPEAQQQQQPAATPRSAAAQAPPAARRVPQAAAPAGAVAQIQAERAGAAASRSLSDGGGVPPAEPLSVDKLLEMDDEEFGLYIDNLPPQRLQQIMGREFPGR